MGTTMGSASILDLCSTKLMEFICNVENKDMVWLQEIKEEALKMFSSDFSVEPELMPKTPSQKNRRRKKRFSSIQDENRPPSRKRLSRRANRRSSQLGRRLLRSKDRLEKLVLVVAENGSIPRGARSQATGVPSLPESPTWLPKKSGNLPAVEGLVPVVEIGISEQRSAEKCLEASKARMAEQKLSFVGSGREDESVPKKQAEGFLEPAPGTSLAAPPEGPQGKAVRSARHVAKLRIARAASPEAAVTEPDGAPPCAGVQPQPEAQLKDLPESPRTPTGSRPDRRSVRRSLVRKSSQAHRVSLIHKYSMVPKRISSTRRSSRRQAQEPAATGRIICHSYLERLLDVEIPRKASSEEEAEGATETDPEVVEGTRRTLRPRNTNKIAISTPKAQPESGGQAADDSENKKGRSEEPREELREPLQSVRRKRSYKQAVSDLDENGDHGDDEALTPPRNKTPSPVCPPSKVVRPLRTFLHTVQKNQMLMTPTSASRSSVMKSFIKRNTPLHMDAKEKERQRLESLKKKEEAELLRKQKVEEDKRRRLEEVKMKREERLRKVLQARERAEQLEVEKKKRFEQKMAQLEKNEKAKEERLAEEKARKKAAAKKLEEAEARRKQEEEARRQKRLQQEEEERRFQEQLQKKKEEEQERLRKLAEARRIMEQQKQREQQLALEREMERKREQERLQAERERQEKERALRLQKERSQRELEEKRKREERQRQEQERKRLQEEQEKKAKEAAAAAATPSVGTGNKFLNVTMDMQSPVCNSYEMTPQGPKGGPKINPDNYGMDLNSDDSTDDETQPRKPIPAWANGTQLSQAVIRQYYQPPDLDQLFGTILSPRLEDIFNKSKPRYHKRTSSAVWHSPPLPGSRPFVGLPYGLKKP
ncbi:inner centromere protein isoform X1 [Sminthopsis crassicaudata]|uniref:inner centromere protein isoform X1 n=1 Tax=Sminthopsis crassicaudata TaxID=9301 RepID=UPI003D685234